MQYELHQARKERLERMGATRSNAVPLDRVRLHKYIKPIEVPPDSEQQQQDKALIEKISAPEVKESEELRIRQIQKIVAIRYRIGLEEINSDSRSQFVLLPRQIAYTIARRLTGKSLTTIGRAFGGRDHTTILHGVRKMEHRARTNEAFATELEQLEKVIIGRSGLPCPCCGSTPTSPNDDR